VQCWGRTSADTATLKSDPREQGSYGQSMHADVEKEGNVSLCYIFPCSVYGVSREGLDCLSLELVDSLDYLVDQALGLTGVYDAGTGSCDLYAGCLA